MCNRISPELPAALPERIDLVETPSSLQEPRAGSREDDIPVPGPSRYTPAVPKIRSMAESVIAAIHRP